MCRNFVGRFGWLQSGESGALAGWMNDGVAILFGQDQFSRMGDPQKLVMVSVPDNEGFLSFHQALGGDDVFLVLSAL